MKRFLAGLVALFLSSAVHAEVITVTPSSGGGSSTITANSTPTSGCTANAVLYNASNKVQCDALGIVLSGGFGTTFTTTGTTNVTLPTSGTLATTSQLLPICTTTALSVQYNNAGAFGCVANTTSNGTDFTAVGLSNTAAMTWNGRGILTSSAAGTINLGAADAASPVAQIVAAQSVVAGTMNTAGVALTVKASAGSGNANSGQVLIQNAKPGSSGTGQNAFATSVIIDTANATQAKGSVAISAAIDRDVPLRIGVNDGTGFVLEMDGSQNSFAQHNFVWGFGLDGYANGFLSLVDRTNSALSSITFSATGSTIIGKRAAAATTDTDGYLYVQTTAGAPTGVPTAVSGHVAVRYDTTNHQFWIYDGAWLQPKTPAGAALVTWQ